MTEKEFEKQKSIIEKELEQRKMKAELRKLKWSWIPKFKKPSTSKLIVLVTFVICLQILWFSEQMVASTGDTSYMYVLLGVPASLIPVTLGYLSKSKKENIVGGITYETTMEELKHKYNYENVNNESYDTENNNSVG